jgi:hypothetical protein
MRLQRCRSAEQNRTHHDGALLQAANGLAGPQSRRSSGKPELTEAQKTFAKKREELARVLEWLGSPGLMPGIARELRKHVAILEREIAELEKVTPGL